MVSWLVVPLDSYKTPKFTNLETGIQYWDFSCFVWYKIVSGLDTTSFISLVCLNCDICQIVCICNDSQFCLFICSKILWLTWVHIFCTMVWYSLLPFLLTIPKNWSFSLWFEIKLYILAKSFSEASSTKSSMVMPICGITLLTFSNFGTGFKYIMQIQVPQSSGSKGNDTLVLFCFSFCQEHQLNFDYFQEISESVPWVDLVFHFPC